MSGKRNFLYRLHSALLSIACMLSTISPLYCLQTPGPQEPLTEENRETAARKPRKIKEIIIEGNKLIPASTILAKIPYHVGDVFKPQRSRLTIKTLHAMGSLSDIQLYVDTLDADSVVLYIKVKEKKQIAAIELKGNKNLRREEIEKKFKISEIKSLDEEELANIATQIKTIYAEKDYHHVEIDAYFKEDGPRTVAQFDITQGSRTHVQRVFINGNERFTERKIRNLLFTREDWLLGFLNKAGSFQPDALEYDKSLIESFYQNQGYLAAQVNDIKVEPVPDSANVNVTFSVEEGDLYTIESVKAPGNTILSEEELLNIIPVKPGQLYSRELIRQTLEALRMLMGEYGYIYAEIEPSIVPDENAKTVQVEFHTNLGNCMNLRRITITGNKKTQDKVIRRQILLDEGELLTTRKMEISKERVQALGYFDPRNGVNWKIVKLDEENADLELLLQEVKTGSFYAQMGTGGVVTDKSSPSDTFRVSVGMQDINFLGSGVQLNLNGSYSRQERTVDFSLTDQWLFNKPLYGGLSFFHRHSSYDEYHATFNGPPQEHDTGIFGQLGYSVGTLSGTPFQMFGGSNALGELGFEHVHFAPVQPPFTMPAEKVYTPAEVDLIELYKLKFMSGDFVRLGLIFAQDARNNPVMPSRGYIWNMPFKAAVPYGKNKFGFLKWELDVQWYTPLINEYDLILRVHGFVGLIHQFGKHSIPYRELYHVGGPATVRGYLYGQIGPNLIGPNIMGQNSLGAKRMFTASAELLFPITPDGSIRGCLFYDGGAGWDTPDRCLIQDPYRVRNNSFDYRHAIGFGFRLTRPTPVRIDVGFKLDKRKRLGESLSEFHFTMAQDF